jgi:hypothetical protein
MTNKLSTADSKEQFFEEMQAAMRGRAASGGDCSN